MNLCNLWMDWRINVAGHSLRNTHAAEEAGVHARRGAVAGARHWANTAIFSLLDAMLIKMLPVQEPQQLVLFGKGVEQGVSIGPPNRSVDLFSYPFYRQVQQ